MTDEEAIAAAVARAKAEDEWMLAELQKLVREYRDGELSINLAIAGHFAEGNRKAEE